MKLIKNQYSIAEVIDLLSKENPNYKNSMKDWITIEYLPQIMETRADVQSKMGYRGLSIDDSLKWFRISREEVERWVEHFESLSKDAKPIIDSKLKKRGRPESHSDMEYKIAAVLSQCKRKLHSQAQAIEYVAEILHVSIGNLERHFKKCFAKYKRGGKKS